MTALDEKVAETATVMDPITEAAACAPDKAPGIDGLGCHSGKDDLKKAAIAAGKGENSRALCR